MTLGDQAYNVQSQDVSPEADFDMLLTLFDYWVFAGDIVFGHGPRSRTRNEKR